MKVYKRSIWSSVTIWACFMPALTLICLILFVLFYNPEKNSLLVIPFIPLIILIVASASAFCYIELTEHELIVRNVVYKFWHKAYPYETITRVRLKHAGGLTQTRLQIVRGQKKSWSYVIDLVSRKDSRHLIDELQRNGILVEVSRNIVLK